MKFKVIGICLVPTYAEMEIEAETGNQAVSLALEKFKSSHAKRDAIDQRGGEPESAFDWQPTAEII